MICIGVSFVLKVLVQNSLVKGFLGLKESSNVHSKCMIRNQHKKPFPERESTSWRTTQWPEFIHARVCEIIKKYKQMSRVQLSLEVARKHKKNGFELYFVKLKAFYNHLFLLIGVPFYKLEYLIEINLLHSANLFSWWVGP